MDLPIRPKPCNLHKPRIRIVEHRETVYETRQPVFEAGPSGEPVATGKFERGMTYAQLSGAMTYAPNGATARAARASIPGGKV